MNVSVLVLAIAAVHLAWAKSISRMCADPTAIDIFGLSLSEQSIFPSGVRIVSDGKAKGYRFGPTSISFGVSASSVLHKCKFFPTEFSFVVTFKSPTVRNENQYLLTLMGPDRYTILLAMRLQRDSLYFEFFDKVASTRKSARLKDPRMFDGSWHTVVISVVEYETKFVLDCGKKVVSTSTIPFPSDLDARSGRFYIASRRRKRNRYTGTLREVKLIPGTDASIYTCHASSIFPYERKPNKYSYQSFLQFEEDTNAPPTCDVRNRGHFIYKSSVGKLSICEGKEWKQLQISEERLDYLVDYSNLETKSKTLDFEIFRIEREGLFLAAANQGRARNMDSTIYKWVNGRFQPYQNITTDSAQDWEFFTIGDEHFLACANQGADERSPHAFSLIYIWDPTKRKFIPHQRFTTFAAQGWESFTIDGKHYIFVTNYGGSYHEHMGSTLQEKSILYVWDHDHRAFMQFQQIDTIGGVDVEYFEANGRHFIAIANSYDGNKSRLDSVIYRWEHSKFIPFQYIETVGAQDWEYFNMQGEHFLAVANYYDYRQKSYFINSTIYRLSESGNRFDKIQDIETTGALDWEYFTVGRDSYIIAASSSDTNANLKNVIYRWQGMEKFVPIHSFAVSPSADWELLKLDTGEYYLLSANVKGKKSKILKIITY